MKISDKERLLLTILVIVIIGVFFFMFLMPPVMDKMYTLQEQKDLYEGEIAEAKAVVGLGKVVNNEYKVLNAKIQNFSNKFFSRLVQERIILLLDQLLAEAGLEGRSIVFGEAVNLENENYLPENVSDIHTLGDLPSQQVTINYSGSFNNLLNFLGDVNNYSKKILVKEVNVINASTANNISQLNGSIIMEFYVIPNMIKGSNGALTWTEEVVIDGISDPFSGGSLVGTLLEPGEDACDFVLTVKPITADLPTVVMGIDADISADSFVFADNPGFEDVELRLFMQDGLYLCSYQTSQESYPHTGGVEIPFVNGEEKIVMKVFSNPRNSEEDLSGVNLKLLNETDLPLQVQIVKDDPLSPRVNIVEQSSNVIIQ